MRRRAVGGIVAASAAVALVVTASIVWPGLDAKETPDVDASVWALQTSDGRRYARVNTTVGELDTVRSISNPDQVVQSSSGAYVFSDSLSKVTKIDEALPADLDSETLQSSTSTPDGTVDVVTADDFVAYLTDAGTVFAGRLSEDTTVRIDPSTDDEGDPQYTADAIAVDDRGMLFAYSRQDASVLRYDITAGAVRSRDSLDAERLAVPAITAAGDMWAVVDTDDGDVWLKGADGASEAPTTGPVVVSAPDASGKAIYLADQISLVRVPVDGSEIVTDFSIGTTVLGTPARPVVHDGRVYAAWLGQGASGGMLWQGGGNPQPLDYGDGALNGQRRPVFVENGDALVLNETRSGWVWSVPAGALVPSSQDWTLDDRMLPAIEPSDEQLEVMLDPKPPVAGGGRLRGPRGRDRGPARAHERPRPQRRRAEHRPGIRHGAGSGIRDGVDHERGAASRRPCGTRSERQRDLLLRRDGRHERERSRVAADDRDADGDPRRDEHGSRVVRRGELPDRVADARGRERRDGHGPHAARVGGCRRRPPAAPVGAHRLRGRQRRGDPRRRHRLPAQRGRPGRRSARRDRRDGRRHARGRDGQTAHRPRLGAAAVERRVVRRHRDDGRGRDDRRRAVRHRDDRHALPRVRARPRRRPGVGDDRRRHDGIRLLAA